MPYYANSTLFKMCKLSRFEHKRHSNQIRYFKLEFWKMNPKKGDLKGINFVKVCITTRHIMHVRTTKLCGTKKKKHFKVRKRGCSNFVNISLGCVTQKGPLCPESLS